MSNELLSSQDYGAIEAAVMETERGRWFLREYAARNRVIEAAPIVEILQRIEARLAAPALPAPSAESKQKPQTLAASPIAADGQGAAHLSDHGLIRQLISEARGEMQALREEAAFNGRTLRDGHDFDAITAASDNAINSVLNAAERIQELSWILRERGMDAKSCDELDQRASEIYLACSFQDMASRRLAALVETLVRIDTHVTGSGDVDLPRAMVASHSTSADTRRMPATPPATAPRSLEMAKEPSVRADSATPPRTEPAVPARHEQPKHSLRPAVPASDRPTPRTAVNQIGNLALSPQEDVLEQPLPALPPGIDYSELSFSEKIALFS